MREAEGEGRKLRTNVNNTRKEIKNIFLPAIFGYGCNYKFFQRHCISQFGDWAASFGNMLFRLRSLTPRREWIYSGAEFIPTPYRNCALLG